MGADVTAQDRINTFQEVYTRNLLKAVEKYPQEYAYPKDEVPLIAAKMVAALLRNSANKDSRAIKWTCKELGIPYTYKGLKEYFGT